MVNDHEQPEVDARLRAALAPDEKTIDRVVMRALAAETLAAPRRRSTYALRALVVTIVTVVGLVVMSMSSRPRRAPPAPAVAASLSITGRGSLLAVEGTDGRRWIVGAPPGRTQRGAYVIVIPR